MNFEEFVEDKYGNNIEDIESVEDLELSMATVTDDSLEQIVEDYVDYCAKNQLLINQPEYLDSYFE